MIAKWNRWKNSTSIRVDGKSVALPHYSQWKGMANRVLNNDQGYENVSISENFLNYDWWYDWAVDQKGFLNKENNGKIWPIDKDIVGDSTIYSEDVCVFVPCVINNLFRSGSNKKTADYAGVSKESRKKLFKAAISVDSKPHHLGYFKTELEAHLEYLKARKEFANKLHTRYGDAVDDRVWDSLFKSCEYSDIPDISTPSN